MTLPKGKTPEQLAAEGHWNGDEVEGAHERLFALVEHYRTLRGISIADAIAVVHGDMEAGRLSLVEAAFVDIYRRWRADCLGTAGVTRHISLQEFAFWMETGQFVGVEAAPPQQVTIKLQTPGRQAAFADVMARMDRLVQDQGLPVVRAAGQLVNEATLSTQSEPCPLRVALRASMGRGGRNVVGASKAHGLPSIETMTKWYLRHRTGAIQIVDAKSAASRPPREWVSREARWRREAQAIKAANPSFVDLAVYAELMRRWRDWWGEPIDRRKFLDEFQRESWKLE